MHFLVYDLPKTSEKIFAPEGARQPPFPLYGAFANFATPALLRKMAKRVFEFLEIPLQVT